MRMKKFLAVLLSVSMVMSFAACGKKNDGAANENVSVTPTEAPMSSESDSAVIAPDVTEGTAGEKLWNSFLETMKENPDTSAIDMATTLSTNSVIQFMAGASEMEPGYLAGFSEEITGFEKAAMYGPMMGSIAFVGYVFELAEDADVAAFIDNLKTVSDPRWNICVEADYTQVGAYENTVYFLMYPADLDAASGEESGDAATDAVVVYPDVAENSWGEMLWESFEALMTENPASTAIDTAFALSMDESIEFMSGSAEVVPGFLSGFSSEIHDFKSGAMFGPMMGSIAFIGYVFELEDGADVEAFMTTLTDNSDPRWNICVEADQTVVGAYNNMVFFLMCPNSNQAE